MNEQKRFRLQWNAGTGAAVGALVSGGVALLVDLITADSSVWAWSIPVGIAVGVAAGAGRARLQTDKVEPHT